MITDLKMIMMSREYVPNT